MRDWTPRTQETISKNLRGIVAICIVSLVAMLCYGVARAQVPDATLHIKSQALTCLFDARMQNQDPDPADLCLYQMVASNLVGPLACIASAPSGSPVSAIDVELADCTLCGTAEIRARAERDNAAGTRLMSEVSVNKGDLKLPPCTPIVMETLTP